MLCTIGVTNRTVFTALFTKVFHLQHHQPVRSLSVSISHKAQQCASSMDAVRPIPNDATVMVGGFGLCGIPENSIWALACAERRRLTVISNNAGGVAHGIGLLLSAGCVKRVIGGYIGENPELVRQYLAGQVEVELVPQGSLAERIRAQAAGIPAFYTPTGYGTQIHHGGTPIQYDAHKQVLLKSEPKEERLFDGKGYILEHALAADFALIKAWKADRLGNLVFRRTARNFNVPMCKAARHSIVEVEEIVEPGQLDPDHIHVPAVYVHSFFVGEHFEKPVAKLRLRPSTTDHDHHRRDSLWLSNQPLPQPRNTREVIAKRAARELQQGSYVNLGVGIPLLVPDFVPPDRQVVFHSENGIIGLGQYPSCRAEVDPDLINAGKEPVTAALGAATFASDESFALIRGGHLAVTVLGAMQVSQFGDLANWTIPGRLVKGMGGAMDLVSAHVTGTRVVVTTEHCAKGGKSKIVAECDLPLTGTRCVDVIITERAVFEVDPDHGLTLTELAPGQTLEAVTEATEAPFKVAPNLHRWSE